MEKNSFEYKNLIEIRKMSLEELNSYYRMLRKYEFETGKELSSSNIKKKIHFLTILILKIDRLTTGRKLIVFDDKREKNIDKGKVYAVSHVGRYDIESAMEAINDQSYFVMGDPGETYRNFEGFFLENIHGRICVDTGYQVFDLIMKKKNGIELTLEEQAKVDEYKLDRHICEVNCTKRIKAKDNILIFPEGAWNITDRLTQSTFPGAAKIAVNGDGVIIPVGIIRDGKEYRVNIGKEFDINGAQKSDILAINNELKELLNTLKGEMIFTENSKNFKRSDFGTSEQNIEENQDDIMSETTNGYTIDVIEKSRFFDPNYPENVFGKTLSKRL